MSLLIATALRKKHATASSSFSVEASLNVAEGQTLGITGPSGCGKSTVLEMLALLSRPSGADHFSMRIDGNVVDLATLWRTAPERLAEVRRRHLGFVHQAGGLYPFLTVRENIQLPLLLSGLTAQSQTGKRIEQLLAFLGLGALADNLPETLSYGERQRTAIARALVHRPNLIVADEPTSALDPDSALVAMKLLVSGAKASGSALVVVSHDHALLARAGIEAVAMVPCSGCEGGEKKYCLASPGASLEIEQNAPGDKDGNACPVAPEARGGGLSLIGALAWKDFRHEVALSLCAVLAFAAALTPFMVLGGLRAGVVDTLSQRLLNNPAALAVNPYSSRSYKDEDIRELGAIPGVAFVVPQTRALASTVYVKFEGKPPASADVVPTAKGDPLLMRYASVPPEDGVVITQELARSLPGVSAGTELPLAVTRLVSGRPEEVMCHVRVHAILPDAADWKAHIYAQTSLLLDMEQYRDGFAVPERGWPGDAAHNGPWRYAGFRMYVDGIDAVVSVRDELKRRGIDAFTFAREVETIQDLKSAMTIATLLVGGVTLAGMAFSLASLAVGNVRRKAMLFAQGHLMGLSQGELLSLPMLQLFLTALLAATCSLCFYACASAVMDIVASHWLEAGENACHLPATQVVLLYLGALALASLCGLAACRHLLSLQPAEVLRRGS